MESEKSVEAKISLYKELGDKDKKINVAALMINALEQSQREETDRKKKSRAYLVSVTVPPLGLIFALVYWFSGRDDGKHIAKVCIVLTVISLLIAWGIGALMVSSLGADQSAQLQTLKPEDVTSLFK